LFHTELFFNLMSKFCRYIPVSILWFAWLVLTVHLMIPHDHHLLESISGLEESCPVSHKVPNSHPLFPVHCHAFNNLVSEKAATYVINPNIQTYNILVNTISDISIFDFQLYKITIYDNRKPFPEPSQIVLPVLRAPPSLT
jgi:hypothetical protein